MRGALKFITIKEVDLYLHWTFLLLIGWVVVDNIMAGLNAVQVLWSLGFVLAVFACIALHELGHILVARQFGIAAKSIILFPIGGVARIEQIPENPKQELLISAAGPLTNILIAMLLSVFVYPFEGIFDFRLYTGIINADNFLYSLYVVNVFLALFNLIPAFPLDGGRILRALLGFHFNYIRATAMAAFTGKFIAWIFIILSLATFNPFLLFIGIFIIFFATTEEYHLRLKALVKGIRLKDALMYDYNSLQADYTVQQAASVLVNNHSKYFIVMSGPKPVGTIDRVEIVKAMAGGKYQEPVRELMKEDLQFFDGETELEEVLDKLASHEERIYPVMVDHQFTGVISFQHIIEYLLLHQTDNQAYGRVKGLSGLI